MIVYISELRPDLLDEVCGKLYLIVTKIQQNNLKKLVIGSAADFSHASRFVIDLSALRDATGEVIEAIAAFRAMYADTRVIVIADREPEDSVLFGRLFEIGVYDIVRDLGGDALKKSLTTGVTKEEVGALLITGYPQPPLPEAGERSGAHATKTISATPIAETEPPPIKEKITANRDFKKHKQFVTVAVCATEPHMGATHNALLMAKFLAGAGFRSCYLEANERRGIVYLSRAYPVNANERKKLLQFEGVDTVSKVPTTARNTPINDNGSEYMGAFKLCLPVLTTPADGKVVGNYYIDNNGVIDFSGILSEGRYTIRETRPAAGYYNDDVPRTVEFRSGQITEIRWENVPKMAQIQILKKSGDDNEVNGLPAGTPLANAIFEAYDYKTGNLVDRFVSGADGRAVSKPLPLGRYLIKEVQAPQWYKLSDKTLDIELEFASQIVKVEYLNYAANTGVYIKKTGPAECMPGDTIRYDIKAVQNTSTVPLTDFYWRDTLPVDAVRLTKIVTGTYNQSLKYKILVTTNKGDTRIIADNLSTTKNNSVDCSNASLGLKNDEYVTSFTLIFGTVKAGFAQVEQPQVYVKVLSTLAGGYQFANKVDCGGKYGWEWVVGNSTTLCSVYRSAALGGTLPRTGF